MHEISWQDFEANEWRECVQVITVQIELVRLCAYINWSYVIKHDRKLWTPELV